VVGANQSLKAAVVGSFVTVIGEFSLAAAPDVARGTVGGTSKLPALRYELEARTLMVVNNHLEGNTGARATTGSVFCEKALALRWKTMYQRYFGLVPFPRRAIR